MRRDCLLLHTLRSGIADGFLDGRSRLIGRRLRMRNMMLRACRRRRVRRCRGIMSMGRSEERRAGDMDMV